MRYLLAPRSDAAVATGNGPRTSLDESHSIVQTDLIPILRSFIDPKPSDGPG
jgi:hypothetical protein